MHRFRTTLVGGRKRPYSSWTFLIVPQALARQWGPGQKAVRGTIAGHSFRGTASRGEGVLRVPIPRELREKARLSRGDSVEVVLELDTRPRRVEIPTELAAVLATDRKAATMYDELPPSYQRAWATYVAEAKRPDTRARRARQAPAGIRARSYPR